MKTVKLATFIENPDNPQTVTAEDFALLVESLRTMPQTLAASKIAYVTDYTAVDGADLRGQRVVIAGNKRLRALKQLAADHATSADGAIKFDGPLPAEWFYDLTPLGPDARRTWLVKSNVQSGEWDAEKLLALYDRDELGDLMGDAAIEELLKAAGETTGDADTDDTTGEYQKFVDKFKPKLTTDDCYTPEIVYNAVRDWCVKEYNLDGREIVRPFWPGGDYQTFDYPPRCVVIDNPPFSIMAEILKFYSAKGIDYFLFAPGLVFLNLAANSPRARCIVAHESVSYQNGAKVLTDFVTTLGDVSIVIETRPDLHAVLASANEENLGTQKKEQRKVSFPMAVVTSARLGWLTVHGEALKIRRAESAFIRKLDAQEKGDTIFGGAFLLCERAAAERAAAERAAAERAAAETFELSAREIELQKSLGAANVPRDNKNTTRKDTQQ